MEREITMVDSITQIVQRKRQEIERSSKTSCPAISKTKEDARELLERFNPSVQHMCYKHHVRCISGNAPTLGGVGRVYGVQVAVDWLTIELNDYQNFVGVKEENKAELDVVRELSRMIFGRYYFLKLSEMMLFFQQLKYGDYGEMYGYVDAVRILRALRSFIEERNVIIERLEQEEKEKKRASERKNAISYEEYLRREENKKAGL